MNTDLNRELVSFTLMVGIICLAFAVGMSAQVQTQTSTTAHQPTVQSTVERGEVVYVSGNELVVKMEDGTLRHFANVPESVRVNVDGKELGIHDLKPGMKLQRTITTTTTPKTITTVQTVSGKVWHVNPPRSVILTLEDGKNQEFKIPENQKFNVNGQMVDAWGLRKGMLISATRVVEKPVTDIEQQRQLTGVMPPPPPPPPADTPILIAVVTPAVPNTPPAPVPDKLPSKLPKTGSELPWIGFMGLLSVAGGLGLRAFRSWAK